jgi:hypothetical protein
MMMMMMSVTDGKELKVTKADDDHAEFFADLQNVSNSIAGDLSTG